MAYGVLVWQELRSLTRGRFTLLAAAIFLTLVTLVAATAGTSAFSDGFYWPAFGLAPLLLIPLGAWQVASARSTRFLQAVFTTPIGQAQYIVAQLTAMILVGLLYIVCLLPFLAVEAVHVGVSDKAMRYVLLGLGSALYSAALGVLVGIAFTSRGSIAAVGAAVVAMVACGAGIIFTDAVIALDEGPAREVLLRLLHLTVGVVLADALGLGNHVADDRAMGAFAFGFMLLGAAAAALWIFSRRQSPEGWHLRRGQALQVAVVFAVVLLVPAAFATPDYKPTPGGFVGYSTSSNGLLVQIVQRGAPPDDRPFHEDNKILAQQENHIDFLLFIFPYDNQPQPFRNIKIRLDGTNMSIQPASHDIKSPGVLPNARPNSNAEPWPYLRVPGVIRTTSTQFLGDNHHMLTVNVSFEDKGGVRRYAEGSDIVFSAVEHAALQMAAVGSPAPLWAAASIAWRRFRTR